MKKIEYHISTGGKSEYYTLWKDITIDLRPRDKDGNIKSNFKVNSVGGNMYYHCRITFIQNLAKTKEKAIEKVKEMGIDLPDSAFDFDLKRYSKPSFEAFGVKLKYKKDKWCAEATSEFWDCWKENKEEMINMGWSCWKFQDKWYMAIKTVE